MSHGGRARTTLVFVPEWNGPVSFWAQKYIRQNKWRVDAIFDERDLLQEAWIIFNKISYYYPRIVEPARFMALFKIALVNWFNDRAAYMKRKNPCHATLDADVSELGSLFGEELHDGYLNILLQEAPEELKLALTLIVNEPEKLKTQQRGQRENLNMRLRRILGLEAGFDLKTALTELLFK